MQKLFPVLFVVACALVLWWAKLGAPEPSTLALSTNRHPLALDWEDTLVLVASGPACGEWGGPQEVIKVYLDYYQAQKDGIGYDQSNSVPRVAMWLRETTCATGSPRQLRLVGYTPLSLADEAAIVKYVQQLLPHSLQRALPFAGGNRYVVRLNAGSTKNLEFVVRDSKAEWNDFGPLRHRLFPKPVTLDARKFSAPPSPRAMQNE